jgi:hypothetical protein
MVQLVRPAISALARNRPHLQRRREKRREKERKGERKGVGGEKRGRESLSANGSANREK